MAKQRIYIDLDSLVDTRLGILVSMDSSFVKERLGSKYLTRIVDQFATPESPFTNAEYLERWKNRNIEDLKNSVVTNAMKFLADTIASINWEVDPTDNVRDVEVSVNFWPYDLPAEVKDEYLKLISLQLPVRATVSSVWIPLELLDPVTVNEQWNLMIAYNGPAWLEMHKEVFKERSMLQTLLIIPKLLLKPLDKKDEVLFKQMDFFKVVEYRGFGKLQVRYEDVATFCMVGV